MKGYKVFKIKKSETKSFILGIHYAKRYPMVQYAYGLYEDNELVGVVTYGIPPSKDLCVGIAGEEYRLIVIELNRLVLKNNKKNEASFLVGQSLRLLPRPRIIVSYADTGQNHNGYIYQATNFIYTGLSIKSKEWQMIGVNKHSRQISKEDVLKEPDKYEHVERSRKHRYIYIIANKKEKKQIVSKLRYEQLPYPKGVSKYYDSDTDIQTQLLLM